MEEYQAWQEARGKRVIIRNTMAIAWTVILYVVAFLFPINHEFGWWTQAFEIVFAAGYVYIFFVFNRGGER